ncbi:MAG: DUF4080 domain-containing protein [Candidatus Nitrohelix vancouverensis]|uniref:DUF4080 domain-containing protein n=1 Tax=Candidatus Nitrohelix vancouverensis TaxID=2705534 RepID=A0A7T0C4B7_9BACT|nr:MAG: DUF4080 domain-containing protein [Candidatus Nitrohelix vancouverensis]
MSAQSTISNTPETAQSLSIGLVTLNAKFVHSSLSLRNLRNAARRAGYENVWLLEFSIGQPVWKQAAEILARSPSILGFGIYIWNRAQTFELIERIHKQAPHIAIAIGGPEVSFDAESQAPCTLLAGEGEDKWVEFLNHSALGLTPSSATLQEWKTYGNSLPDLLPPYGEEDLPNLKNRIVYLETSRGCPYLCSFCLSALDKTVRYFEDADTEKQIELLIQGGVKQIKFVDRTFNLKPKRMKELMSWLTQFEDCSFHFEVVGDILSAELNEFFKTVPEGMFQFEIGIQTTNEEVQNAIQRKQNAQKLLKNLKNLIELDTIHLHCDLIFGLPGENLQDILQSFEEIVSLKPHELQLGFLKFLPGSPICKDIEPHGYQYQSTPPYELICHNQLSAEEVVYLKKFEEAFDLFYNTKRFYFSFQRQMERLKASEIINRLIEVMESRNLFFSALSLDAQYRIFHDAFEIHASPLEFDLLRLDYLYAQRVYRLPEFLRLPFLGTGKEKLKAWSGDGKTPLMPFRHNIKIERGVVQTTPSDAYQYYAIEHVTGERGYHRKPRLRQETP